MLTSTLRRGQIHSPTTSHHELDDQIQTAGGLKRPVAFTKTKLADIYRNNDPTKKLITFKGVIFQYHGKDVRVVYSERLAIVRITSVNRIATFFVEEGHHYPAASWHLNVATVAVKRRQHCFSLIKGGLTSIHLKAPAGSAYVRESTKCPGVFMPFSRTHGHTYRQFVCCQCNAGFCSFEDLAMHSGIAPKNLAHW